MRDEDRYKLIHGPYLPPRVEIGDWLECEVHGLQQVKCWSEGRIPWPCAAGGKKKKKLIVCDGLVRALQVESLVAVRHWWGVGKVTVSTWRKALNVPRTNEGTSRLHRDWREENISPEQAALGRRIGNTPEKRAQTMRKKKKRGNFSIPAKEWTPEMISLLGTMPDRQVAEIIGRAHTEIGVWRRKFGIPAYDLQHSQGSLKGKSLIVVSARSLRTHRFTLGVSQRVIAERAGLQTSYYGELERGLLSRVRRPTLERLATALQCQPDELIDVSARPMEETLLPVTAQQKIIQQRRRLLQAKQRRWTPEEDALLGTMSDNDLADRLGCLDGAVLTRRRQLGIPAFNSYHGARGTWNLAKFSPARLQARRKEMHLKQREVADCCGIPGSQYGGYESGGRKQMRLELLQRLAQTLRCRVVDLQDASIDD
jgi:transcriptional regulator with XRE-family HTH domain